ncbi:MAG: glutaredoxin domain-containing protein [Candidatus Nanoarchaeia archaeon]
MEVTIYTTPTCPYCVKTKEFFKEKNVKYKEINVLQDQKAGQDIISRSGQIGVPQIEIIDKDKTTIVVGYDRAALVKALQLK